MDRTLRRLIKALDVMNVFNVSFHVRSASLDVVPAEILFGNCIFEMFLGSLLDQFSEKFEQGFSRTAFERAVSSRNGWAQISSRGLQTRVRSALSSTMKAYHRLKEIHVRKIFGLRAQFTYCQGLLKRPAHLTFVLLLNPNQDRVNVAALKRSLGRLHHWPVHPITMSRSSGWSKKGHHEQSDRNDDQPKKSG